MSDDFPSRGLDKFVVRFPDGMRDRIREAAERSGRSMNAEIIHRLQSTLDSGSREPDDTGEPSSLSPEQVLQIMQSLGDASRRLGVRITLEAYPEPDQSE